MLSNGFIENWSTKELTKLNWELRNKYSCFNSLRNNTEKYQIAFAKIYLLRHSLTYFFEF